MSGLFRWLRKRRINLLLQRIAAERARAQVLEPYGRLHYSAGQVIAECAAKVAQMEERVRQLREDS